MPQSIEGEIAGERGDRSSSKSIAHRGLGACRPQAFPSSRQRDQKCSDSAAIFARAVSLSRRRTASFNRVSSSRRLWETIDDDRAGHTACQILQHPGGGASCGNAAFERSRGRACRKLRLSAFVPVGWTSTLHQTTRSDSPQVRESRPGSPFVWLRRTGVHFLSACVSSLFGDGLLRRRPSRASGR